MQSSHPFYAKIVKGIAYKLAIKKPHTNNLIWYMGL